MDGSSAFGLIAIVVLVLANGFFVATEFAIVAVRRTRLEQLVAEGRADAKAARDVVAHLDAYIAATQLGITMASLALGWIGEPVLADLVEPWLAAIVGRFAPAAAHGVAIATAFTVITGLHIVLGELAPKGLALQYPERTSLWVARPIKLFYAVFRWPVSALNGVGNLTLRLFGLRPAAGHEMVHSVEELRLLVTGMQRAGVVEASEARIAARAFNFADLTAGALMTARTELEAVPITATPAELLELTATTRHVRLPVYDGSIDNVVGVLRVHDLFRALRQPPEQFMLSALARPALFVPESKAADDLMDDMRATGQHFAVVVDEHGGTAGIVTLTDLLEGLVGKISEEPDPGASPASPGADADGAPILDGLMRLDELEEKLGVQLDEADRKAAETVGGLVMARLGRVPLVGEKVLVAGRTLRVEARDRLRVASVRLLSPHVPGAAGEGEARRDERP